MQQKKLTKSQLTSIIFGKIDRLADEYNAQFCTKTPGQRAKTLKSDVLNTFRYLVSHQLNGLFRQQKQQDFDNGFIPLRTNSKAIATKLHKCQRTVRYHMDKLAAAGLMFRVFRGVNTGFEVYLCDELTSMFSEVIASNNYIIGDHLGRIITANNSKETSFLILLNTNFATINYNSLLRKLNNSYKETKEDVDMLVTLPSSEISLSKGQEHQKEVFDLKLKPLPIPTNLELKERTTEKEQEGPGGKIYRKMMKDIRIWDKKQKAGFKNIGERPELPQKLHQKATHQQKAVKFDKERLVRAKILAKYAMFLLYPNDSFSELMEEKLLLKILPYYSASTPKNLELHHAQFMKRVDLVFKYLSYNTSKSLPNPTFYFDISNKNGFTGSKRFYSTWKEQQKRFEAENFVQKHVRSYFNGLKSETTGNKSDNNVKNYFTKTKSNPKTQQKSAMELYRSSEQAITKKYPNMLPVFYAKVGNRIELN